MHSDTIFYQLFRQSPAILFDLLPNPPANSEDSEREYHMNGYFSQRALLFRSEHLAEHLDIRGQALHTLSESLSKLRHIKY
jgi:predicted transposase YdaD